MAIELERLMVRLEVNQRKFERQMQAAAQSADRNATKMERRFRDANRSIDNSFQRLGKSAGVAFGSIAKLAIAAAGALGTREVARYADAWTELNNKLRAAEQISGKAARSTGDLNDIANATRSGLEETVDLYAKLLRATASLATTEEDVARATQIVNQAFKAGGAAASEQAAGILQLSQALSSGVLQGDELRSLRENAPLIAQAIADEFGTTIGGLKELGAEGELTAARVFQALLKAQGDIEAAFSTTIPTIADGFTALRNGALEFVGAFNESSGAAQNLTAQLQNLGAWLSDNTEAARRLGAQVKEAFVIMAEAFTAIGDSIGFEGITDGAIDASNSVAQTFVDLAQAVLATVAGMAAASRQAFINVLAATGEFGIAIANATIDNIESILQGIVNGVQLVLDGINAVIRTANQLPGVDLPTFGDMAPVSLGRIDSTSISAQVRPISEAYTEAANDVIDAWDMVAERIATAALPVQGPPAPPPPGPDRSGIDAGDGGGEKGGKKGGGGRSGGKEEVPFFETVQKEIAALEDKIAMIGMTQAEIAEYTTRQELLNEAKKRGLDLDAVQAGTGETLRQQIDRQAAAVGNLTAKYEQLQERADFWQGVQDDLKNGFIDAIVEGENLAGVFQELAKQIAKAALQAALFNEGPLAMGGGGGGLLGGLFSGLFRGFSGGGYTGPGGKYDPAGIVHKGEYVFDQQATRRIGVGNLEAMSRGIIRPSVSGMGGMKAPASAAPQVNVAPATPQVVIVDNPQKALDALNTPQGEAVIVDIMRRYA